MPNWRKAAGRRAVHEQLVRVECYSGYKADESPRKLILAARTLDIVAVEDRWYSPGETYFRVSVTDGDRYVLRHQEAQDVWSLVGYRSAVVGQFPVRRLLVRLDGLERKLP
jgi:hypothetical protein